MFGNQMVLRTLFLSSIERIEMKFAFFVVLTIVSHAALAKESGKLSGSDCIGVTRLALLKADMRVKSFEAIADEEVSNIYRIEATEILSAALTDINYYGVQSYPLFQDDIDRDNHRICIKQGSILFEKLEEIPGGLNEESARRLLGRQ